MSETLDHTANRGVAIAALIFARAADLIGALVTRVAEITKVSLLTARLIVAGAAVLVVVVFAGLHSVTSSSGSPEATARDYIQASMNQDGTRLLDITCTASQGYVQSLIGSTLASTAQNMRGLNLNDITYTTTTRTDIRAVVHVAGGRSNNVNADLQENVSELYERGQWRLCPQ